MQKVTLGASAAKTVVEEYVDANLHQKRRRPGNERLKKDRDYLQSLSRFEHTLTYVVTQIILFLQMDILQNLCLSDQNVVGSGCYKTSHSQNQPTTSLLVSC